MASSQSTGSPDPVNPVPIHEQERIGGMTDKECLDTMEEYIHNIDIWVGAAKVWLDVLRGRQIIAEGERRGRPRRVK